MENLTSRQSNVTDYANSSKRTILVIQLICYSAIIFVGTFGNIFIFISMMRKKKRKISDYFIINLSITDLLCCIISIPFDIMELTVGYWPLGLFMCKLVYPLQTILMAVSVGTLLFMAFERHQAIMHPLRPKIRGKYVLLTVIALWVTAVGLVCPYMVVLKIEGSKCMEDWPGPAFVKAFTTSVFVLLYVVPLSIITAAYIRVGTRLRHGSTSIRHALQTSLAGRRMLEIRSKRNIHVVKIFVCAVIAFAGCLLPFHIMWLWYDFGDAKHYQHYHDLLTFANILVYSNSAINPFIFGSLSKKFRGCVFIRRKRQPSRLMVHRSRKLQRERRLGTNLKNTYRFVNGGTSQSKNLVSILNGNSVTVDGNIKNCRWNNNKHLAVPRGKRESTAYSIIMTSAV